VLNDTFANSLDIHKVNIIYSEQWMASHSSC